MGYLPHKTVKPPYAPLTLLHRNYPEGISKIACPSILNAIVFKNESIEGNEAPTRHTKPCKQGDHAHLLEYG